MSAAKVKKASFYLLGSLVLILSCKGVNKGSPFNCSVKITLPNQVLSLRSFYDSTIILKNRLTDKYVCFVSFDPECSLCVADLNLWNKFLNSIHDSGAIAFIFLPYGDSKESLDFALKNANFNYPVFLDKDRVFYEKNEISNNEKLKSVVTSRDFCVLLQGSPFDDNNLKDYMMYVNDK
jgi:hypothetical protein